MNRFTRGELGWSLGGMVTLEVIQTESLNYKKKKAFYYVLCKLSNDLLKCVHVQSDCRIL